MEKEQIYLYVDEVIENLTLLQVLSKIKEGNTIDCYNALEPAILTLEQIKKNAKLNQCIKISVWCSKVLILMSIFLVFKNDSFINI